MHIVQEKVRSPQPNQQGGLYYAGAASGDTANRIQYTAHGAMNVMKLGNGKWEHSSFNGRLQPLQIGLGTSSGDSSVLQLDYTYGGTNNNGNVETQTITVGAMVICQSYTYDKLNRLWTATEPGAWSQNYGYDRYGNRWLAERYAGGHGVVLEKTFSQSQLVRSPDVFKEGEFLIRGLTSGATVKKP